MVPLTQIGTPPGCSGFGIMCVASKCSSGESYAARCSRHSVWHTSSVWSSRRPRPSNDETGGVVLLALPADADAEVEAAARQHVERGGRLRQHRGPPQRGDEDVGAEPDARRHAREHRERGQRLEPVPVGPGRLLAAGLTADLGSAVLLEPFAEHDVVGHDEPVDARFVGDARGVEQGLPGTGILGGERTHIDRELRLRHGRGAYAAGDELAGGMMQRFWSYLAVQLGKHAIWVTVIGLLVTIGLGLGITQLEFATGQDSYLNKSDQVYKDNVAYQDLFGGQAMLTVITMDDGHTVDELFTGDGAAAVRSTSATR